MKKILANLLVIALLAAVMNAMNLLPYREYSETALLHYVDPVTKAKMTFHVNEFFHDKPGTWFRDSKGREWGSRKNGQIVRAYRLKLEKLFGGK